MTRDTLEPLAPAEALEMHLQSKKTDGASPTTIRAHRIRLTHFIDWCKQESIENLNTLTGRDCHRFKLWRQDDGDLNKVSVKTQMDTLRVFLRTCASVDGVSPDLPDKVKSPSLGKGENSREVMVSPEAAADIEKHLRKYDYASLWHAYVVLLRTGLRNGAIRSLDIDDYLRDEEALQLKHRPEQDTPLKNGDEGERFVSLDDNQCTVLNDWLDDRRPAMHDDYGREPLLATSHGRVHGQTLRRISYKVTRPCFYSDDCPHDRLISDCEAADDRPSKCPSSKSPHPWRRLTITQMLRNETPAEMVGDRCNVSKRVIDEHYDERDEQEKMEARREWFDSLQSRGQED